ncbi:MAG: cytochrome P450 [Labilithrix sp.]|nr:cytochrome P450 [Labilithrix sp.]MCW5817821.1 cytochrome P450 [Labilithrix sp.]
MLREKVRSFLGFPPRPDVPGPNSIVLCADAMVRRPLEFLTEISKEHGDVVRFPLLQNEVFLFNHPDAIEELVVARKDLLVKDWLTRELGVIVGKGLLLSEGALWKKQRRLVQPGFHRERIAAYADVMVRYAERATEEWTDGETRDVHVDLMRLTLDIVAKTLFGVEVTAVARRVERCLEVLAERFSGISAIIPLSVPIPQNFRTKKAIAELDEIIYGIIRERRARTDGGDLVSMLIDASEGEDSVMDDRQLRDEAITLLLAGHETTALSLGYALHLLGRHPLALAKLRNEVASVLGDRPATAADVSALKYTDAVIRESMRLYPPAWAIGREATQPLSVAGIDVEKGAQLWAAQWVVHRDPRWFPEPERFDPERWLTGPAVPKHAYFPFGGGPRVCIGNAFATMEMVLVLVTIARRFDLSPEAEPKLVPSVTLRPKGGLPMQVRRRSDTIAT